MVHKLYILIRLLSLTTFVLLSLANLLLMISLLLALVYEIPVTYVTEYGWYMYTSVNWFRILTLCVLSPPGGTIDMRIYTYSLNIRIHLNSPRTCIRTHYSVTFIHVRFSPITLPPLISLGCAFYTCSKESKNTSLISWVYWEKPCWGAVVVSGVHFIVWVYWEPCWGAVVVSIGHFIGWVYWEQPCWGAVIVSGGHFIIWVYWEQPCWGAAVPGVHFIVRVYWSSSVEEQLLSLFHTLSSGFIGSSRVEEQLLSLVWFWASSRVEEQPCWGDLIEIFALAQNDK